jgi:microcystin-dependent protein
MSDPYQGEIRIMSFNYPPQGWALCNGQLLPINQNQPLFSLFGTMYGGDGRVNFALPDLRGRVPIHLGNGHTQGETGGQEAHTVTQSEMPAHIHALQASATAGDTEVPTGATLARTDSFTYSDPANLTTLDASTVTSVGGSQPHENMQPYTVLNFCVALQGVFPSRD